MSEIERDPSLLGGIAVFKGTRVPVRILFDILIDGGNIEEFLIDYPTVAPKQVKEVLNIGFNNGNGFVIVNDDA